MFSTADEVITLVNSALSYFLGSFKYGLVSFNDFLGMNYYTTSGEKG